MTQEADAMDCRVTRVQLTMRVMMVTVRDGTSSAVAARPRNASCH